MSDLLDFALEAHGGLKNWKGVTGVDLRLTLGGYLFEIKQHPDGLRTTLVKVDARKPRTLIVPFPERGKRGIYQEGKVWVQTDAGAVAEELRAPRTAHEGHDQQTPWNDLQYLYFIGYAFWNYFTTPFLLASDGVICEEVEPWDENCQKWRVLRATFDSSIDIHCAVQKFSFDDRGMLQRHDYFTDVAKGNAAHYCMDCKTFDGFVPTRRRVVSRLEGGSLRQAVHRASGSTSSRCWSTAIEARRFGRVVQPERGGQGMNSTMTETPPPISQCAGDGRNVGLLGPRLPSQPRAPNGSYRG